MQELDEAMEVHQQLLSEAQDARAMAAYFQVSPMSCALYLVYAVPRNHADSMPQWFAQASFDLSPRFLALWSASIVYNRAFSNAHCHSTSAPMIRYRLTSSGISSRAPYLPATAAQTRVPEFRPNTWVPRPTQSHLPCRLKTSTWYRRWQRRENGCW